ncbi:MAG: HD domain-containing protein [Bacteroidales bacterium]|nr:HD domain-containing protein [Bacteroidales bacterium]
MSEVTESLKAYIEAAVIPQYDSFDAAHRRDHVQMVIDQSLEIARNYGLDADMAYTVAAYHDTGLAEGRDTHHIVSGRIIRGDHNLRQWFNEKQIEEMAQAAEDHRASSGREPRSIYGKVVSEADRFIDPENIIVRTVQYSLANYPEFTRDEHYQRSYAHLVEKYGDGGYLKLWFENSQNHSRLEALRRIIRDEPQVKAIFDTVYEQLTKK